VIPSSSPSSIYVGCHCFISLMHFFLLQTWFSHKFDPTYVFWPFLHSNCVGFTLAFRGWYVFVNILYRSFFFYVLFIPSSCPLEVQLHLGWFISMTFFPFHQVLFASMPNHSLHQYVSISALCFTRFWMELDKLSWWKWATP
jgi:hypothetical protein